MTAKDARWIPSQESDMSALSAQTSISVKNVKTKLNMNILSWRSKRLWKKTRIKKISDFSRESSSSTSNLLTKDTNLQAMKKVQEKGTATTKKFGDLPLFLVENLNNTVNMLKNIKTRNPRMSSSNMLWTMECLKKSSMRNSLTSESKNYQNVLEIHLKNTESLSVRILT